MNDLQITSTIFTTTTTEAQPIDTTIENVETTTSQTISTIPIATPTDNDYPLYSSNQQSSGHTRSDNQQKEQLERANLTNINKIEIVNGDNFVKITNSSDDVVDVEITESNNNDSNDEKIKGGDSEMKNEEILFKMNVFAIDDKLVNDTVTGRTNATTEKIPTESLEIIIIEENESSNENQDRGNEELTHRSDDLFEVVDHNDNEKPDESMEKPPDLIFQANIEEQKPDDDFFTTVFEVASNSEKSSEIVSTVDVTNTPNWRFQEEIYINHPTTIKVELPTNHQNSNKNNNEDEIKLKTTEKDSDTTFYISNTEVKVIETGQTPQPNTNQESQFFLAPLYEEDVIIDFSSKNSSSRDLAPDKYEADIILSPLSNNFDGISDINYIGESFLNIEEITTRPPQSGVILNEKYSDGVATSSSSSSSSDIIIEPEVQSSNGIPVIEVMPPQIELGEMIFNESDDDEYILNGGGDVGGGNPFFINDNRNRSKKKKKVKTKMTGKKETVYEGFENNLIKSPLTADLPKNASAMSKEEKLIAIGKSVNATGQSDNYTNATAFLIDDDETENGGFLFRSPVMGWLLESIISF
jgi:hypothetical protein